MLAIEVEYLMGRSYAADFRDDGRQFSVAVRGKLAFQQSSSQVLRPCRARPVDCYFK